MKKFLPLLFLLCSFTKIDYDQIKMGISIQEVINKYGDPYSIEKCGDRRYDYVYLENFAMNNELVYSNRYVLSVVNDQVIDKRVQTTQRQPYDQMYRPDPYYPQYP